MQTTFAAAAHVLAPPFQHVTRSHTTVMQGTYRGHAACVSFQDATGEDEVPIVYVSVVAPLHDVVLRLMERGPEIGLNVTPGKRPAPLELHWDPAFRARFSVGGAPNAVLREWLTTDLQSAIVNSSVSRLSIEDGKLEAAVRRPSDNPAAIASALDAVIAVVTRLPHAISAAGCGAYLARGSLATHPDVVALRAFERRASWVGGVVIAAILLFVLGGGAVWLAACLARDWR